MKFLLLFFGFSVLANCADACICYGTDYSCNNDAPCSGILKTYHSIPEWEADPSRPSSLGLSYIYTKYDELVNLSSMKSVTDDPINIQLGYTNTVGISNLNGVNFTGVKKIIFTTDHITMINDVDQKIIFKSYENLYVSFNITVSDEFTIESSVSSTVGFRKIIIFGKSCLLNCENYNQQVLNLDFAGTFKVIGTNKQKIIDLRKIYPKTPLLSMFVAPNKVCIGKLSCENGFSFETTAEFEDFIQYMEFTSQIDVYLGPSITEIPYINEAKLGIHSSSSFNFNHDIQAVVVYDDHISLKIDKDQRTMISFYDTSSITAQIASKYIKISNQYETNVPSIDFTIKPTNALSIDIENIKTTKYITLSPDASIDVYSKTDLTQIFTSMTNVNNIVISSNSFCVCSGDCSSVCPDNSHTSEQFIELAYETLTIGKDIEIDFDELHISYQDINVVGNIVVKNANEICAVAESENAHLISTKSNVDWSIKSSDTSLVTINIVSQTPFELISLAPYQESHSFSFKFDITEDNCYIGYYTKYLSSISYGSLISSGTYTVNIENANSLFSSISSSLTIGTNSYITIIGSIQHTFESDIAPFYGNDDNAPIVYKKEFKEIASSIVYCFGYQELVCNYISYLTLYVYGLLTVYEVKNFYSNNNQASFDSITLVETIGSSLVRLFMTSDFFTDLRSNAHPDNYKLLVEIIVSRKSSFLGRSENIIFYENSYTNSFTLRTTESATYINFINNDEYTPTLGAHVFNIKTFDSLIPSICIASEYSSYCGKKELTLLYKSFNDITAEPEKIGKYDPIIYNTVTGTFDATKLSSTYRVKSSTEITVKKADQVKFEKTCTSFFVDSAKKFIIESAKEVKIQGRPQKTVLTFAVSNPFIKTTLFFAQKVNYFYSSYSYNNVLHVSSIISKPIIASDSSYLDEIKSLVISDEVPDLTFRNIEEVEEKVCVCRSENYETDCQPMCGDAEFANVVTDVTVEPSISKIYFVEEGHEVDISTFAFNHIFYGNPTIIAEKIEFNINAVLIYGDADSYSPVITIAQRNDFVATLKPKNNKIVLGPSRDGMPIGYYTTLKLELTTRSYTELSMIPYSYSNCKSNYYCYSSVLSIFTKLDKAFFKVKTSENDVFKYLKTLPSNVGSYSTDLPDIVTCICAGEYRDCRTYCGDVDEGFVNRYDSVEETPTSIDTELIYIKDDFSYTEKWDGEHTIICNGNITISQSVSSITSPNNDKYLKASGLRYKLYSKEGKIVFNSQSSEFNLKMNDLNSQVDVIFNPTSDFIKFTSNLQFSSYNKKRINFSSLSSDNPAVLTYDENTPTSDVSNMLEVITLNEVEIISSEFAHKVVCFCKDTNCQNYCHNPATSRMVVFSNAEDFVDKSNYDDYEFWFYSITGTFSQTQFSFERTMNTISHYESSVLSVNNVDQIEKGDKYVKIGRLTINLDQNAPNYEIKATLKSECTINTLELGAGITESAGKVQLYTTYSHISGTINERNNAFTCYSGTFAFDSITTAISNTFITTGSSQIVIYENDSPYICICQDSACDGCNYGGNPSKYSSFSDITTEPDSSLTIQLLKDDAYPSEWIKEHHVVGTSYQSTLEMNSYSKEITLRSKSIIVGNVETTNIKIKLINDHHIDISIEEGVELATENIVEFIVINGVFFNFKLVASTTLFNIFTINSDTIYWPTLIISDEALTGLFTHTGNVEGITFEQNEMPTSSLYCISATIQECGNFAPVFYKHFESTQDLINSVGEPENYEKIIITSSFNEFHRFEKKHIFIVEDRYFSYNSPKKIVVVDNGIEFDEFGTFYSKKHKIYFYSYHSHIPIFNVAANVKTVPYITFDIIGPLGITLKVESCLTPLSQAFDLNVDTIFLAPPCTDEIKGMFKNVNHIYCEDDYEGITCIPQVLPDNVDAFAGTICLTSPHSKVHYLLDDSDTEPIDTKIFIAENYKLNIENWENAHEIHFKGLVYPVIKISLQEEGKTSIWNSKNIECALFDMVQIGLNIYGTEIDIKKADIACPHNLVVQNNVVTLGAITVDKTYSNPLFIVDTNLASAKLGLPSESRALFTVDSKITFKESEECNILCICADEDPQICSQACGTIDDNVLISDRMIYNKIFNKYYIHADSFDDKNKQIKLDSTQMKETISINVYNPNVRYIGYYPMTITVIGANNFDLTNEEIISGNFKFSKNAYLNLQSATSEYTVNFPSDLSSFELQFIIEFTYKTPTLYINFPTTFNSFNQIIGLASIFDPAIPVKLILSTEDYSYDRMIMEFNSVYIIDILSLKYTCLYNTNEAACDKSEIYVNEDITLTYKDSISLANYEQGSVKYLYIAEDLPAETEFLIFGCKMVLGNPNKEFSFAIKTGDYESISIYGSFHQLNYQCSYRSTIDLYQSIKKQNAALHFTKIQFDFETYYYDNQETISIGPHLLEVLQDSGVISITTKNNGLNLDPETNIKRQMYMDFADKTKFLVREYKIDSFCFAPEMNLFCGSTKDKVISSDFHKFAEQISSVEKDVFIYLAYQNGSSTEPIDINVKEIASNSLTLQFNQEFTANFSAYNGQISTRHSSSKATFIDVIDLVKNTVGTFLNVEMASIRIIPSTDMEFSSIQLPQNTLYTLEQAVFETDKGQYTFSVGEQCELVMTAVSYVQKVDVGTNDPITVQSQTKWLVISITADSLTLDLSTIIQSSPNLKIIEVKGDSHTLSLVFPASPVPQKLMLSDTRLIIKQVTTNTFAKLYLTKCSKSEDNDQNLVGDNIYCDVFSIGVTEEPQEIQIPDSPNGKIDVDGDGIKYSEDQNQVTIKTEAVTVGETLSVGKVQKDIEITPASSNENKETTVTIQENGKSNAISAKDFDTLKIIAENGVSQIPINPVRTKEIQIESNEKVYIDKVIPNEESTTIKVNKELEINTVELENSVLKITSGNAIVKTVVSKEKSTGNIHKASINALNIEQKSTTTINNCQINKEINFSSEKFDDLGSITLDSSQVSITEINIRWNENKKVQNMNILAEQKTEKTIIEGLTDGQCSRFTDGSIAINFIPASSYANSFQMKCENQKFTVIKVSEESSLSSYQTISEEPIASDDDPPVSPNSNGKNKLSGGEIAGIVVGCVAGVAIIVVIVVIVIKKKKKANSSSENSINDPNEI